MDRRTILEVVRWHIQYQTGGKVFQKKLKLFDSDEKLIFLTTEPEVDYDTLI